VYPNIGRYGSYYCELDERQLCLNKVNLIVKKESSVLSEIKCSLDDVVTITGSAKVIKYLRITGYENNCVTIFGETKTI